MMSKQQLQMNREQQADLQDKLRSKMGPALITNKRGNTEKYGDVSDDINRVAAQNRIRNYGDDEGNSSLYSRRNNQEEEIRKLHEQLEQREFDLNEMRYQYVASLKSKEVGNDVNINYKSDDDDTQAMRYFSNSKESGLNADGVDEDEESSFSSYLIRQSLPPSTQQKRSLTDVQSQGKRDNIPKKQSGYAASSSSSLRKSTSNDNRDSLTSKKDVQARDSQVIDLIEFRNTATKEFEKLRSSYELLKIESGEKRSIVEDTCGRLIRFISAIESSTLHGRHACGSKTVMGLLMKTRQGLELLHCSLYATSSIMPSSTSSEVLHQSNAFSSTATTNRAAQKENDIIKKRIHDLRNQSQNALKIKMNANEESLESALLQMCKHLESENTKLEGIVASLKDEIKENSGSLTDDLIPHYRVAVVRSRTEVSQLQEELKIEKRVSRGLRKQLEAMTSNMLSDSVRVSEKQTETGRREQRPDGTTSWNSRDFENNAGYGFNDKLNRKVLQNNFLGNSNSYNSSGVERNRNMSSHIDDYSSSNENANRGRNVRNDSSMSWQNSTVDRGRERGRSTRGNLTELVSNGDTYAESVQGEAVQSDIMELDQEIGALKGLLEEAAMKHTQRIIAEVIDLTLSA